ncbi:hypothetical protein PTTG_30237 [Puccinia triticina 1-1 BBBD Race 1]|uniref:Uncharacterized protein n=1 Tax=Puccinia triticina (isolate 1-1 / race 1 (BBBD)) TaxID=630390 RepID=A0A180G082_PUCT1|nr:hypothetical protein PTTG_30237 [Puccinia triticina 1-1 BBBD Race 1]
MSPTTGCSSGSNPTGSRALVVWKWREVTRIVQLVYCVGQQTNPSAAISLFGETFSSFQVNGVIRCFSIVKRRLVSQHTVQTSYKRGLDKPSPGGEVFQLRYPPPFTLFPSG